MSALHELISFALDFADEIDGGHTNRVGKEAAADLARLESALAAARVALQTHGFVVTLNGATGKRYLRCRDCNGYNLSLDKNEMSNRNVRHKPDCKIAAALAAVSEEAG